MIDDDLPSRDNANTTGDLGPGAKGYRNLIEGMTKPESPGLTLAEKRSQQVVKALENAAKRAEWVNELRDYADEAVKRAEAEGWPVAKVIQFTDIQLTAASGKEDVRAAEALFHAMGLGMSPMDGLRNGLYANNPQLPQVSEGQAEAGLAGTFYILDSRGIVDSLILETAMAGVSLWVDGSAVTGGTGNKVARFMLRINATDKEFAPAVATVENTPALREAENLRIQAEVERRVADDREKNRLADQEIEAAKSTPVFPVGLTVVVARNKYNPDGSVVMESDWKVAGPSNKPGFLTVQKPNPEAQNPDGSDGWLYKSVAANELAAWQPKFEQGEVVMLQSLNVKDATEPWKVGEQEPNGRVFLYSQDRRGAFQVQSAAELLNAIHAAKVPKRRRGLFGRR